MIPSVRNSHDRLALSDRATRAVVLDDSVGAVVLNRSEDAVNWLYLVGAVVSVGLLAYLLIALLKPEKF